MAEMTDASASPASGKNASQPTNTLTPELIREVTEKVYRLIQRDITLARQRTGIQNVTSKYRRGMIK